MASAVGKFYLRFLLYVGILFLVCTLLMTIISDGIILPSIEAEIGMSVGGVVIVVIFAGISLAIMSSPVEAEIIVNCEYIPAAVSDQSISLLDIKTPFEIEFVNLKSTIQESSDCFKDLEPAKIHLGCSYGAAGSPALAYNPLIMTDTMEMTKFSLELSG